MDTHFTQAIATSCSLCCKMCEGLRAAAYLIFKYRSEEHTSELQSRFDLVCRLLLEKNKVCRYCNVCLRNWFAVLFFSHFLPLPQYSTLFPYTTLFRSGFASYLRSHSFT